MNSLTWLFLESTLALAALLFVVLFVLLVYWRRSGVVRPLLVGLAAAVVLLVVQSAVVTQREQAGLIMGRVEQDILDSKVDALAAALSSDFWIEDAEWDSEKFIERVRHYMRRVDVLTLMRRRLEVVERGEDTFTVEIAYLADVRGMDYAGVTPSNWRIQFVREGEDWRIRNIIPRYVGGRAPNGWRRLPSP